MQPLLKYELPIKREIDSLVPRDSLLVNEYCFLVVLGDYIYPKTIQLISARITQGECSLGDFIDNSRESFSVKPGF